MALNPLNARHAAQIQAGIEGRRRGHEFEFELTEEINNLPSKQYCQMINQHVISGSPASILVGYVLAILGWEFCDRVEAIALGALATAEEGKKWLEINEVKVRACKSDVLLTFYESDSAPETVGISVKQCNNKQPTNAQLYFSTAHAFCELLRRNNINISERGELALKQFCGDNGYRPLDNPMLLNGRLTDPRRFFWEEIDNVGRRELENAFTTHQDNITRLLLQKAYLDDPFTPEFLIHKTRKIEKEHQEFAIYTIDELISLSRQYQGFTKKQYSVRKGRYRDPAGIAHEAPRFGIVQMQRGGQKQHPSQLQFNIEAGYFFKI